MNALVFVCVYCALSLQNAEHTVCRRCSAAPYHIGLTCEAYAFYQRRCKRERMVPLIEDAVRQQIDNGFVSQTLYELLDAADLIRLTLQKSPYPDRHFDGEQNRPDIFVESDIDYRIAARPNGHVNGSMQLSNVTQDTELTPFEQAILNLERKEPTKEEKEIRHNLAQSAVNNDIDSENRKNPECWQAIHQEMQQKLKGRTYAKGHRRLQPKSNSEGEKNRTKKQCRADVEMSTTEAMQTDAPRKSTRKKPERDCGVVADDKPTNSVAKESAEPRKKRTPDSEDDPNRLYCLCKQRYNPKRLWIGCDGDCDESWFHYTCVGLKSKKAQQDAAAQDPWFCAQCQKKAADSTQGSAMNSKWKVVQSSPKMIRRTRE